MADDDFIGESPTFEDVGRLERQALTTKCNLFAKTSYVPRLQLFSLSKLIYMYMYM